MEDNCVENNVELLYIRQNSESEAQLKSFHFVFKFGVDKVELAYFWPENVSVSIFYLNEAARDSIEKVSKLITSQSSIRPMDKKGSTELNLCLHNPRSVGNGS